MKVRDILINKLLAEKYKETLDELVLAIKSKEESFMHKLTYETNYEKIKEIQNDIRTIQYCMPSHILNMDELELFRLSGKELAK